MLKLQKIDTETIRLRSTLDGVAQKIEALDIKVADFSKDYTEKKQHFDNVTFTCRSHEANLQITFDQIEKSERNLRAVKTNREYQTLLREIDDNKKKISVMENEMLQMMEQMESEEKIVSEIKRQLDQLIRQVEKEKQGILNSTVEEKDMLSGIENERRKVAEKVDPALLRKYDRILEQCGGLAIVPVENGSCCGCHINIPPQEYIEVQRGESLRFCPHCHRIMYWDAAD